MSLKLKLHDEERDARKTKIVLENQGKSLDSACARKPAQGRTEPKDAKRHERTRQPGHHDWKNSV